MYEDVLTINCNDLEKELVEFPKIFMKYSLDANKEKRETELLKLKIELFEATASTEIRKDPKKIELILKRR